MTTPTAEEVAKARNVRAAFIQAPDYAEEVIVLAQALADARVKALEDSELHVLTTAAMNRATAEGLEMTIRVKAKRKTRAKP